MAMASGISNYDENLTESPFFLELTTLYKDVFQEAVRNHWLICVPCSASLDPYEAKSKPPGRLRSERFDQHFIMRHILVPSEELPETHFHALDDRPVVIFGRSLTIGNVQNRILFSEICYNDELQKFKLLCLESALVDPVYDAEILPRSNGIGSKVIPNDKDGEEEDVEEAISDLLKSVSKCKNFIMKKAGGKDLLHHIERSARTFEITRLRSFHNTRWNSHLRELAALFVDCVEFAIKNNPHVKVRFACKETQNMFVRKVCYSIENCMMEHLHAPLIRLLAVEESSSDAQLNKNVRNLIDELNFEDFGLKAEFKSVINKARKDLIRCEEAQTPRAKLEALNKCMSYFFNNGITKAVGADELLPAVIFTVAKTCIPSWYVQLSCMKKLQLATEWLKARSVGDETRDANDFHLATLEAALEYIRNGGLRNYAAGRSMTAPSAEPGVFECIYNGDVKGAQLFIENFGGNSGATCSGYPHRCHPLCDCLAEAGALSIDASEGFSSWTDLRDEKGRSPLHVAALLGNSFMVEMLLSHLSGVHGDGGEQLVDAPSWDGSTALHLASAKGHQNVVLMLLHSNASLDVAKHDGSTPLHSAVLNGQDSCVKALIFFAEHRSARVELNSCDAFGNTPLHLASKWGYSSIVEILVEHEADVGVKNKQRMTPSEMAHDALIARMIDRRRSRTQIVLPKHGDSSAALTSRLFKAINVGDVSLVSQYFGIRVVDGVVEAPSSHHQFCNCEKCEVTTTTGRKKQLEAYRGEGKISWETGEVGSTVNCYGHEGMTPLQAACKAGNLDTVKLLMEMGASLLQRSLTLRKETTLHIACRYGQLQVADSLTEFAQRSSMPILDVQDSSGNTPLHYCCLNGNYEIVVLLLNRRASITVRNADGRTPLEEAVKAGHTRVARLLERRSIQPV